TNAKISTAQYMEQLDTIMESDGETEVIMIYTTKKDGVGEIHMMKRTPKRVLSCIAKPNEQVPDGRLGQVGNSNSTAKT
ncbi:MAG: hypothetical protein ACKO7B_00105, partial [Flavobacteriales bacterium]